MEGFLNDSLGLGVRAKGFRIGLGFRGAVQCMPQNPVDIIQSPVYRKGGSVSCGFFPAPVV